VDLQRKIFYVAHAVSGDVDANVKRALGWLRYLRHADPANTFIAPWIAAILSGEDDNDPTARERGLVDCETVAARCDGIVLVGGRVSSGMARERDAVLRAGGDVRDLTPMGEEPPQLAQDDYREVMGRFDTTETP